jgi:predicted NAD/FAD-binding protein
MTNQRARIAVVGAGVSGLGAAWALKDTADVVVLERTDRVGGHAWTVEVDYDGETIPVDIGFICYNELNYPNLKAMFARLGVDVIATDMSFAVSDPDGYEWGSDVLGLFAWKRNLVDPRFLGLLNEILRFNALARRDLAAGAVPDVSLRDYLDRNGFSQAFRTGYLLPMGAAIWSTPEVGMLDYPVASFIQFFDNHRLMQALRPTWLTVKGGSREYVRRLSADLSGRLETGVRIETIRPVPGGEVEIVETGGRTRRFDRVLLSCHADEARRMLDPAFEAQRRALEPIRFSSNTAYLHRDHALMPQRRSAWASWNVIKGSEERVCVTYWMNRLQKIRKSAPLFVTLNPVSRPAEDRTFGVYQFDHPMYDAPSAAGRSDLRRLQGRNGLYFSGAWLGDGFHEAGLRTGLEAAIAMGGRVPWTPALQERYAQDAAHHRETVEA